MKSPKLAINQFAVTIPSGWLSCTQIILLHHFAQTCFEIYVMMFATVSWARQ